VDGPVVGVDLGIARIAVSSDNRFFSGKRIQETNNRYFRLRRVLQAQGTKSARRKLRRLRRREARFRSDVNHTVSKRLVERLESGSTIALEELTGIRDRAKGQGKRQRRQIAGWSFYDLRQKIEYKAQARGIRVWHVDPAYTSQTCPLCGHISKSNRQSQSWFCCQQCGYQSNADRVAAINLAQKSESVAGHPPSG
jgi:IS605 OrfB family transposase